jgi:hypothetical protein
MADHFEFNTSKSADAEPPTVALSISYETIEGKEPQDIVDFNGAGEEENSEVISFNYDRVKFDYSKDGSDFIDDVFSF